MTTKISTLALSSAVAVGTLFGAAAPALADGATGVGPVGTDGVSTVLTGSGHAVEDCGKAIAAHADAPLRSCSDGSFAAPERRNGLPRAWEAIFRRGSRGSGPQAVAQGRRTSVSFVEPSTAFEE